MGVVYEDEGEVESKPFAAGKGETGSLALRVCNFASFLVAVVLNSLGSTGHLSSSGKGVGDVSNDYATKITPAGYAFSIWGIIYFLMAAFVIWQLLPSQRTGSAVVLLDHQISWLFVSSNVINSIWIISWVQGTLASVWIACLLLFALLATLLAIMLRAELWENPRETIAEMVVVDATFSIYAGWVTAASIVNASVALKASGWYGSGFPEDDWSALMGCVAAVIYLIVLYRRKDGLYGLVYCWAAVAIIRNNPESKSIEIAYSICVGIVGLASLISLVVGHRRRMGTEMLA